MGSINQLTAKVDTVMYLETITPVANSDERKHNPGSVVLIFDELLIPAYGCQYCDAIRLNWILKRWSDFQFPKA
jgi:hypothetical protein